MVGAVGSMCEASASAFGAQTHRKQGTQTDITGRQTIADKLTHRGVKKSEERSHGSPHVLAHYRVTRGGKTEEPGERLPTLTKQSHQPWRNSRGVARPNKPDGMPSNSRMSSNEGPSFRKFFTAKRATLRRVSSSGGSVLIARFASAMVPASVHPRKVNRDFAFTRLATTTAHIANKLPQPPPPSFPSFPLFLPSGTTKFNIFASTNKPYQRSRPSFRSGRTRR